MEGPLQHSGSGHRGAASARGFLVWLFIGDSAVCVAALALAYMARVASYHLGLLSPLKHSLATYLYTLPVVLAVWVITFDSMGLYRGRRSMSGFGQFAAVFKAVSLLLLVLMALLYLHKYDYSRALMVLFWVTALVLASAFRAGMNALRRRQLRRGRGVTRAIIVGCNQLGGTVLEQMQHVAEFGYRPVGFVRREHRGRASFCGLPVLGHVGELPRLIPAHAIDEVFVAEPEMGPAELLDIVSECDGLPVAFRVVSGPMGALTAAMDLNGVGDLPVLNLRRKPFGAWQRALKRTVDVALGTAALVLSLPLWLTVAALIKLTTKGRVLFRQERIGQNGRPFVMYKFRSMAASCGTGSSLPVAAQARLDPVRGAALDRDKQAVPHGEASDDEGVGVTPIGRFLRKYSLDELPQLLNVLKGEMSLVGPRPELPRLVARYEPWQRKRLEAKPGMTGLWQILGRKDLPLTENIHYDFYYIRNQSLLFDLAILLRTIPVVLSGRGAY